MGRDFAWTRSTTLDAAYLRWTSSAVGVDTIAAIVRSDLRRKWRSWVVVGVVAGLVWGVALSLAAGARRSEGAFDRFTAFAQSADFTLDNPPPDVAAAVTRNPGVAAATRWFSAPSGGFIMVDGRLRPLRGDTAVTVYGPRHGVDVDRPLLVAGRYPSKAGEVLINAAWSERTDLDVGDQVELHSFQSELDSGEIDDFFAIPDLYATDPTLGTTSSFTIVGSAILSAADISRDATTGTGRLVVDVPTFASLAGVSSAEVDEGLSAGSVLAVRLRLGVRPQDILADLDEELAGHAAPVLLSQHRDNASEAERPYVMALWIFCVLSAFAFVVVIGPALVRQAVADSEDNATLRALGADRRLLDLVALARAATVAATAAVTGAILAVVASRAFPVGAVRDVDPDEGISVDGLVVTGGVVLVIACVLVAWVVGARTGNRRSAPAVRGRRVRRLGPSWLPVSLLFGLRFAFPVEPRHRAVTRSTLVALVIAAAAASGAAVFGGNVDSLARDPDRHGWSWDLAVTCNQGYCAIEPGLQNVLSGVDAQAWGFLTFSQNPLPINGRAIPVLAAEPGWGPIRPLKVTAGRVPERDDEVALGASTMRALGVAIGDEVSAGPRKLRVVGRAVFSGIGLSDAARASLGEGAALTLAGLQRQGLAQTDQLPNVAVVNAQPIEPIRDQLRSRLPVLTVAVVQLPGVLAAWPDLRPFTLWLALVLGGLALGTMVHGLALTRRLRTRELSTLTALGLRPSQIRGSIVWQSVLLTATTAAVGVTAGIVAALAVWRATADHLGVVSPASSPTLAIAGIALAFALVVAAVVATALRLSPLGRSAHRVRQE